MVERSKLTIWYDKLQFHVHGVDNVAFTVDLLCDADDTGNVYFP